MVTTRNPVQCGSHLVSRLVLAMALCVSGLSLGCASARGRPPAADAEFWGFTAPWDPRSEATATAHDSQLDVIV